MIHLHSSFRSSFYFIFVYRPVLLDIVVRVIQKLTDNGRVLYDGKIFSLLAILKSKTDIYFFQIFIFVSWALTSKEIMRG